MGVVRMRSEHHVTLLRDNRSQRIGTLAQQCAIDRGRPGDVDHEPFDRRNNQVGNQRRRWRLQSFERTGELQQSLALAGDFGFDGPPRLGDPACKIIRD